MDDERLKALTSPSRCEIGIDLVRAWLGLVLWRKKAGRAFYYHHRRATFVLHIFRPFFEKHFPSPPRDSLVTIIA